VDGGGSGCDPGASAGALIEGVLTLNAKGCFEVDDYILVAPFGSYAIQDPVGIYIPEVGVIPSGSTIFSAGAYVDRLVSGPHDEEVTTWDTYLTSTTKGFAVLHERLTPKVMTHSD
jgi:hypothetical protein